MTEAPGTTSAAPHHPDGGIAASAARPAVGALYHQHGKAMHESAGAVLRSAGLAWLTNDVVQDVFLNLMRKPLPNNIDNWESFLRAAARNKALDLVKSAPVRRDGGGLVVCL